ncbi:hypothetical protein [Parathalassolituus penaei]|uniref:Uncharacterized protein n=1 Tax=Parathalassolituus penaei TaxID=2997323 RepID=A0A9X3EDI9_9GAMM|nr:hypothetical protein [Parathalassolituus penaei]MCY0965613.1 hypothetical protein [Parathalassolituus penaei]
MRSFLIVASSLLLAAPAMSADTVKLEGISVMGGSEDTSIMTITSWKSTPDIEIPFEPIEGYQKDFSDATPLHPRKFQLESDYAQRFQRGIGNLTQETKGTR